MTPKKPPHFSQEQIQFAWMHIAEAGMPKEQVALVRYAMKKAWPMLVVWDSVEIVPVSKIQKKPTRTFTFRHLLIGCLFMILLSLIVVFVAMVT